MGILDLLKLGGAPRPNYLASPFTDTQLQSVVLSDVFQVASPVVTRAEAMAVPSVRRARQLITNTVARNPLRVLDKNGLLPDEKQPSWSYRTDDAISPYLRMVWTIDDLFFYGCSLWQVVRGTDGFPLSAERVAWESWRIDEGVILINEEPANANDVIFIPGTVEGLLDHGTQAIRAARDIDRAVAGRVKSPIPIVELHQLATEDGALFTPEESEALAKTYIKGRQNAEGAVIVTPPSIEMKIHGDRVDMGFATDGRNAVRLDIANLTNVPAALLEGSTSEASLTYSTTEGRRNEFVDFSLSGYFESIQTRLSQDDVVPRGQRVRFDLTDFYSLAPSPTGPESQD